ncbi:MAG: PHP domain-containing protein, partial [Verrucomicrobiota bacterium]
EIVWAEERALPRLVDEDDLRGTFHNHTRASDGRNTLEEMAAAAKIRGWEYLGIADHSKASYQANGLDEARVAEQRDRIRRLNESGELGCHLFAGIECDILPDGSLDLDDALLGSLDYVVASVHNAMSQDFETMTRRLIRALEHPATTMLGHPTGRLLLRREGYKVDLQKVIDAAIANGKIIEINGSPMRMELDWRFWRRAADRGLMTSINPDAHSVEALAYVRTGLNVARKGWLTAEHVLNTRSLSEVQDYLKRQCLT